MSEKALMKGNEAIAEAAIRCGCRHYFGYPITPQTEIAAYMAKRMPKIGGTFLQAESEIAAINMVYGAGAAGARAMTSSSSPGVSLKGEGVSYMAGADVPGVIVNVERAMTSSSSPGISLKAEGMSYLAGADLPALIVNVQRGGPGLGGIQPSQSDYFFMTRGPGHGDFHIIVLAPATVQEMADMTRLAFELGEKYRMPAMLLADGTMGQMMEPVVLPEDTVDPETIPATKPWATTGTQMKRTHNIVNSLYLKPDELEKTNFERFERYAKLEKDECRWEEYLMDDAEVCVISVGITARVAKNAIAAARKEGIKVGMIRPITLYPFPKEPIAKAASKVKSFLTVELNMGQMNEDVKLAIGCSKPVAMCNRVGGMIPSADEVLAAIRKEAK